MCYSLYIDYITILRSSSIQYIGFWLNSQEATRLALVSGDQATYARSIRIMGDIYRKKAEINVSCVTRVQLFSKLYYQYLFKTSIKNSIPMRIFVIFSKVFLYNNQTIFSMQFTAKCLYLNIISATTI